MGRRPCCAKIGLKQGPWAPEEDKKLINFILSNDHNYQCCWRAVPEHAGLLRCGKSCRLRWTNYLRPDLKRGVLSEHEEKLIIDLHSQLGNKWSKIASHMPGRTDNEIKNLWHTQIKKKLSKMGTDPLTHKLLPSDPLTQKPLPSDPPPDLHQNHDDQSSEESTEKMDVQDKVQENDGISLMEESIITITDDQLPKEKISMDSNNGFSIDEVPFIEPNEILVTNSDLPISYSSTSFPPSASYTTISMSTIDEDLKFLPSFEDWHTRDLSKNSSEYIDFSYDDDFFDWDWLFNVFDVNMVDHEIIQSSPEIMQSSPDLTGPNKYGLN